MISEDEGEIKQIVGDAKVEEEHLVSKDENELSDVDIGNDE